MALALNNRQRLMCHKIQPKLVKDTGQDKIKIQTLFSLGDEKCLFCFR